MSEHARKAMLDSTRQQLIESMADFLDDETTKLNEAIAPPCCKELKNYINPIPCLGFLPFTPFMGVVVLICCTLLCVAGSWLLAHNFFMPMSYRYRIRWGLAFLGLLCIGIGLFLFASFFIH